MNPDKPFGVRVVPDPGADLARAVRAANRRAEAGRRPTAAAPLDRSRDPFRLVDDHPGAEMAALVRAESDGPVARKLRRLRAISK